MPFTPSHAVVALPFLRGPIVPAAVAVGAMTPDFPLFVRGTPLSYGITHTVAGSPVTLLAALVLLLAWRCLLRPAAGELSPAWIAARLPAEWDDGAAAALRETFSARGERDPSLRGSLWLILGLAIGVLSHVLWDAFTHEARWGLDLVPILMEQWGPLAGYTWMQHGSSAIGLGLLIGFGVLWLRRRVPVVPDRRTPAPVRTLWWMSLPAVLLVAWNIGLAGSGPLTSEFTVEQLAYEVLPPACALWGLGSLILALGIQVSRRRRSP
ncbi:DUF4184 family protein [Microbacterium aquimaris]|uniref:DUF4184 family protein n=1 Tax=Microbacterium aquimaris TaxID=459816 RepID=UPI002AD4D1F8|nr:DUF4184 family protein [Microbacterium aquimaris]MDZ8274318.1 DUF4184 family protein [Microbacterium aquimaris]